MAQQLVKFGIEVLVLEAGDTVARKPEELDQRCDQHGIRYRGAESGEVLGWVALRYCGGQLIPPTRTDFASRPDVGFESWPIDYEEVASYFSVVKQQLGLAVMDEPEDDSLLRTYFPELSNLGDDFLLRLSEWMPFKKRNFAKAFADDLNSESGPEVWLNAFCGGS